SQVRMPESWSTTRFNLHSASVAIMSDLLVQHVTTDYAEGAFVAGLLHDVGKLVLACGLPAEYDELVKLYQSEQRALLICEEQILGFTHPAVSFEALGVWKLPEPIRQAVRDHNCPSKAWDGEAPLWAVVQAADHH